MDFSRKLLLLRQDRLLKALSQEEIERVGREAVHHQFSAGQYIYTAGERAHSLYFLKTGRVMLSLISSEGKEKILAVIRPGDMFGELVLAPGFIQRRSNALACDDVFACSLTLAQMTGLMLRNPGVAVQMAQLMARKVGEALDEVELLSFASTEARVTLALLRLGQQYSGSDPASTFPLTHEQLARLVGASRETVTGILGKLRRLGALDFGYGTVTVYRSVLGARLQNRPDLLDPPDGDPGLAANALEE